MKKNTLFAYKNVSFFDDDQHKKQHRILLCEPYFTFKKDQ